MTALALLKLKNLFAVAMLAGIYSLLSAGLFTVMDAVDVAFTEAAVGAGISTVLMLGCMALVGHEAKGRSKIALLPLFVVLLTGGVLAYGTLDLPPYGDPANPIHHHVANHYLEESGHEIGVPNVVTSVLASYRGYDTMGETTVIFTAMIGVLLLMAQVRRREEAEMGGTSKGVSDTGGSAIEAANTVAEEATRPADRADEPEAGGRGGHAE